MKPALSIIILLLLTSAIYATAETTDLPPTCITPTMQQHIALVKQMFSTPNALWEIAKTDQGYDKIYSKDFVFDGNGSIENYATFKNHMRQNMKHWTASSQNTIAIKDMLADKNKVMVKLHVTAIANSGKKYTLDSFELLQFKNSKVYRWWETAYPDWRQIIAQEGEKIK